MSASVSDAVARKLPRGSGAPVPQSVRGVKLLEWSVAGIAVLLLTLGVVLWWPIPAGQAAQLIPWLLLVTAAELLPISYGADVNLTLSMPLLLAAGMTFGPVPAGLLGFAGSWDGRLLRHEITWGRAMFNRGQIALSSMAAAWVFHSLGGDVGRWPEVIGPCLVAVAVDIAINGTLVSFGAVVATRQSFASVIHNVVLDHPLLFVATYAGLVPLALLMATAAHLYGIVGLAAGVVPILMARQVFALLKGTSTANRRAREQEIAIQQLNQRIEVERRDERARLAMDLHDGALAELYRVHLMGEVLRQDLRYGRLLELEADVPELHDATSAATDTLRALIRNLRDSSVGAQGVGKTLELLIEELSARSRALFHTDIVPVAASASMQLVIYQVAREALENTVRHADAQNVFVTLRSEGDWVRLVVRDDGCGFIRAHVNASSHFGLTIMSQRVEMAGGTIHVGSEPGWGTQVVARLPVLEGQDQTSG